MAKVVCITPLAVQRKQLSVESAAVVRTASSYTAVSFSLIKCTHARTPHALSARLEAFALEGARAPAAVLSFADGHDPARCQLPLGNIPVPGGERGCEAEARAWAFGVKNTLICNSRPIYPHSPPVHQSQH